MIDQELLTYLVAMEKRIIEAIAREREPEPKPVMTTEEVALLVGVSVKTVRRWVALGNVFPFVLLPGAGHDYRFLRTSVMEWARQRELGKRK
jgi:excisionase family DNA binding protein